MRLPLWLLVLLPLWACSPEPEGQGQVVLGWTFADSRRCAESGVEQVAVLSLPEDRQPVLLSTCVAGFGQLGPKVTLPAGERTLRVDGLSAAGSPLYRATRDVTVEDGDTAELKVSLVFIGGM